MNEFEIAGKRYRSSRLNAFKQLAIARRLAPLLLSLAPGGDQMRAFGDALAGLKDSDTELVMTTCLEAVEFYNSDAQTWARVWNSSAQRAMFEHLYDLSALLPLVTHVIRDNLGNFTDVLPMFQSGDQAAQMDSR